MRSILTTTAALWLAVRVLRLAKAPQKAGHNSSPLQPCHCPNCEYKHAVATLDGLWWAEREAKDRRAAYIDRATDAEVKRLLAAPKAQFIDMAEYDRLNSHEAREDARQHEANRRLGFTE